MESKCYIFKTKKSEASRAFLTVLFLLGVFHSFTHLLFGIAISLVALFFAVSRDGVILDFKNKRYKSARIIGNVGFSRWQKFPDFKYISIFNSMMVSTTCSIGGIYISLKKKVLKINLIYDRNKRLNVYQDLDGLSVYDQAQKLAKELNLRIYDATTRSWIDLPKETDKLIQPVLQ